MQLKRYLYWYYEHILTAKGRIGRLKYVQYLILNLFLAGIVHFVLLLPTYGNDSMLLASSLWLLASICSLPMLLGDVLLGIRRLHDIGLSGWLLLISLIPYLNVVFEIFLLLWPGVEKENHYGNPVT